MKVTTRTELVAHLHARKKRLDIKKWIHRERKGTEWKGREGKERERKGREGKGRKGRIEVRKGKEGKGRKRGSKEEKGRKRERK